MILRRLAQHLREQNWMAIAIEFVLLVVGVFLGIQAANWNAERQDRSEEARHLQRLAADLRQDLETYDTFLAIYAIKQQTILALRDVPPADVLSGDLKDAALRLEYSLYKAIPAQRRATFDELVGSGTLRLLGDEGLRDRLAAYYADYDRLSEVLALPLGDYARRVVGAIPGEIPIENLQQADEATAGRLLRALEALRADPALAAAANAEIYYGRDIHNHLLRFRAQAEGLLRMLDESMGSD